MDPDEPRRGAKLGGRFTYDRRRTYELHRPGHSSSLVRLERAYLICTREL